MLALSALGDQRWAGCALRVWKSFSDTYRAVAINKYARQAMESGTPAWSNRVCGRSMGSVFGALRLGLLRNTIFSLHPGYPTGLLTRSAAVNRANGLPHLGWSVALLAVGLLYGSRPAAHLPGALCMRGCTQRTGARLFARKGFFSGLGSRIDEINHTFL